jgi:hypothetical protein
MKKMTYCEGTGCSQRERCLRFKPVKGKTDEYFPFPPREQNCCIYFVIMTESEKKEDVYEDSEQAIPEVLLSDEDSTEDFLIDEKED